MPPANDGMADAASWIRHIVLVPRNDMNMCVKHRLACRSASVEPDVETIWCACIANKFSNALYKYPKGVLFVVRAVKVCLDMTPRHYQYVAWRGWMYIFKGYGEI